MGPMTVSELARKAGVSPDAVRYYARMELLSSTRNRANGYRQFAPADVRRLTFIKQAQSLGFSLTEIATIIQHASQKKSPCPMVREIIERRIAAAGEELEQLIVLRDRMKKALAKWQSMPDTTPSGDEICRLIEAVDVEQSSTPTAGNRRGKRSNTIQRARSTSSKSDAHGL